MLITHKNKSGFTLIEVVLVLAIGGLIFLLAFLAFQQVSVNRRDTWRRGDVRQVLAAAENFAADNNFRYPCSETSDTNWSCHSAPIPPSWPIFKDSYVNITKLKDPSGQNYTIYGYNGKVYQMDLSNYFLNNFGGTGTGNSYPPGTIIYAISGRCEDGALWTRNALSKSAIGFWIILEKGSTCVDNT